jgi:hypothetical protein
MICTKFDWCWPACSGEEDFSQFSVYFYSFPIISTWKRATPWPKDDLCQVWLKLAQWFWRFLNDPNPFLHFCDYLTFEEDLALHLNKREFPSPSDNLYQVWLNLARWFWRFLKIFSVFLSPLGEGLSLSFEQTWINLTKDDFCQVGLKLVQCFWRRSRKCKSLQTDAGQRAIRKAHLSFQLRW